MVVTGFSVYGKEWWDRYPDGSLFSTTQPGDQFHLKRQMKYSLSSWEKSRDYPCSCGGLKPTTSPGNTAERKQSGRFMECVKDTVGEGANQDSLSSCL